ncbi:N-6 DNA methylase [Deinococcus psychrotolerans]|uniref:Methyltransferase n=2 Tax=Deinococcus TaxID=1298 RepID=A0A553US10_9DEIO|nr:MULTISPECIES: RsmD family RNA methyltransferase [Deinococcus]AZI42219.1 N-6 DNA methylase [Deinococcus psychrotolerans]TSA83013.1 methyltransferase [Deinococcus detaillensis]
MSVRILGGVAKGRALKVPQSARPSTARLRKSLFDLLYSRTPDGATFIDLHGGSGAIGLEAASRGYQVTLIEKDSRAIKDIEQSARDLELRVRVLRGDTNVLIGQLPPHDIIFADPPYAQDVPKLARQILGSPLMGEDSLLIVQHPSQTRFDEMEGFAAERRTYGSNVLTLYTRQPAGELP